MAGPLSARAVADLVGGRLVGPADVTVDSVAPLDRAGPTALSLFASARYADRFRASGAGLTLVAEDLAGLPGPASRVVVADPPRAMAAVVERLYPATPPAPGVDPTARLGRGVTLGDGVAIAPHAVLEDGVRLGDRVRVGAGAVLEAGAAVGPDSVVGPRVVIGAGTVVGARVTIKPGAVLGGTGFGYISDREGHRRIPHVGGCRIEDDVDIGANACIDRGSLDDTVIGAGTKIDNLVHVAHNVRIGRRCLLMAEVGVAGSTRIGDDVVLAGQSGVAGHLTVGDRVRAAAQTGIIGDVPAGTDVSGVPARPNREFLRSQAVLYRLAPLLRDLEAVVRKRDAHG